MKLLKIVTGSVGVFTLVVALSPRTANAVPAFARKTGMACASCHYAFPKLNAFGEAFRLNGYRFPGQEEMKGPWSWKDYFPIAVQGKLAANYRNEPAEGQPKVDAAVDTIQLFFGGPIAEKLSMYIHHHIVEAGESGGLHEAWLQFDQIKDQDLLNIKGGQFELPLQFSPDKRRFMHFSYPIYSAPVGFNNTVLGGSRIGLELNGYSNAQHWGYALSVSNEATFLDEHNAFDNNDNKELFGRLFYKWRHNTFGFFGFGGSTELENEDDDLSWRETFYRAGIEWDYLRNNAYFNLLALFGEDADPLGPNTAAFDIFGGFAEIGYQVNHWFLPALRYDWIRQEELTDEQKEELGVGETEGGHHGGDTSLLAEATDLLVPSLQFLVRQNAKLMLEYQINLNEVGSSQGVVAAHFAF